MTNFDRNLDDNMDYFKSKLMQAHKDHLHRGVCGCDPRLFWYFPAYRSSIEKGGRWRILLRKAESLSIRLFPEIIKPYQKLCRIPNVVSPYGLALFVQAYCKIYQIYKKDDFLSIAIDRASQLRDALLITPSGNLGVPNPLEPVNSINLPAGSEAIYGFIDLYDITADRKYLNLAKSIADSFIQDFCHKEDMDGNLCLDYTIGGDQSYILNANALAAGALAQVAERLSEEKYDIYIKSIMKYLERYILDAADLPYSGVEDKKSTKIYDVYHTGFTLRGMSSALTRVVGGGEVKVAIDAKLAKMRNDFLNKNGIVKESKKHRTTDIHGVAEYIRCISELGCKPKDVEVFKKNIEFMSKGCGFYYQRGIRDIDIYMPRWGHAPMMLAIAHAIISHMRCPAEI